MTPILLALLATAVLTTTVAITATHPTPTPPAPRCDICGQPCTTRQPLITHPDDPMPSHWAACPTCHTRHEHEETADVSAR